MKRGLKRLTVVVVVILACSILLSTTVSAALETPYFNFLGSFNYTKSTHELNITVSTINLIAYRDNSFCFSFQPTCDLIGGTVEIDPLYNSDANSYVFGPSPGGSTGDTDFLVKKGGNTYLRAVNDDFTIVYDGSQTQLNKDFDMFNVTSISTDGAPSSKFIDDVNSMSNLTGNLYMKFTFTSGIDFTSDSAGQITTGTLSIVPEPISSLLFIAGGGTLGFATRLRKRNRKTS